MCSLQAEPYKDLAEVAFSLSQESSYLISSPCKNAVYIQVYMDCEMVFDHGIQGYKLKLFTQHMVSRCIDRSCGRG